MTETFDWAKPATLWSSDGSDFRQADFFRPLLLEYSTDHFMQEFLSAARSPQPAALQSAADALNAHNAEIGVRKLYQAVHGRYYLVCASLCCRVPGLPDRAVRLADGEKVYFVLRKLVAGAGTDQREQAWIKTGDRQGWQNVSGGEVAAGEEPLPLFFAPTPGGRTLLYGYVPVASQDTYRAGSSDVAPQADPVDSRLGQFQENVTGVLDALLGAPPPTPPQTLNPPEAQQISLYLLLDLCTFLKENAPRIFSALRGGTPALTPAQQNLVNYLRGQKDGTKSLAGWLVTADDNRDAIQKLNGGDALPFTTNLQDYHDSIARLSADTLEAYVFPNRPRTDGVIADYVPTPMPFDPASPADPSLLPKFAVPSGDGYVLRCVYERPQCAEPQFYLSRRTDAFQLAAYFDTDAPARPIRIPMPTDVSIAGLRKLKKSVGFMLSTDLRNKMSMFNKDSFKGMVDAEGGATLGFLCSFSIPIITICAFVLLLVILIVLNIVFWWLPFFRICIPILLPSSKKSS